jgi:hypothetical protein
LNNSAQHHTGLGSVLDGDYFAGFDTSTLVLVVAGVVVFVVCVCAGVVSVLTVFTGVVGGCVSGMDNSFL